MSNNPILETKNLTIKVKESQRYLLRDVSFNLYESEKLSVFGGSGSGKSLLCKTLLGLKAANLSYSGELNFSHGEKTYDLTDERTLQKIRGRSIALVFQDIFNSLNPMLTVWTQFKLFSTKNNIPDLLKKVGFTDPQKIIKRYPSQLSGGELTRLGLAMAIAQQPKIIILDEAFRSIHAELQELFIEQLNSLVSDKKMSLLLVTHNVAILKKFADRIIILKDGKIIDETTIDQFFKSSKTDYGKRVLKVYKHLYL